jgi:hypothetical protein
VLKEEGEYGRGQHEKAPAHENAQNDAGQRCDTCVRLEIPFDVPFAIERCDVAADGLAVARRVTFEALLRLCVDVLVLQAV